MKNEGPTKSEIGMEFTRQERKRFAVIREKKEGRVRWVIDECAEKGLISIIAWLREIGCRWGTSTMVNAACGGQLATVIWLRLADCPWDEHAIYAAAEEGQLEVVRWLIENDCPREYSLSVTNASMNGHLEVVKFLKSQGFSWDESTVYHAASGGHLETVKWLIKNGCPFDKKEAFDEARDEGHLATAEWLLTL